MRAAKSSLFAVWTVVLFVVLTGCSRRPPSTPVTHASTPPSPAASSPKLGLQTLNGVRILTLVGSPEEMGRQHGELLGDDVRFVLSDVLGSRVAGDDDSHRHFLEAVMVMETFLDDSWRRELHALADSAKVDYPELVALQLFGDVRRAQLCSSFAAFGHATASGECVVGRNFDYFYPDAAKRASIIIDYHPAQGRRFMTVTWAGVINGWTLMNDAGLVTANNTAYSGGVNSLEGVSTCFMLRRIAERADSVQAAADLVRSTPRACATNLLIAGGSPPQAAVVEYDHDRILVRSSRDDYVLATNHFVELDGGSVEEPASGRYAILEKLIRDNYGRIDRSMNFAAADGVPISSINLHSVILFPRDLTFSVAMGQVPAHKGTWTSFRMTPAGIVSADPLK